MGRNSGPMGITVSRPDVVQLNDDRTETYIQALRSKITTSTQIVVTICPTSRDDRYAAIKKVCCSEIPVPSQVKLKEIIVFIAFLLFHFIYIEIFRLSIQEH